MHNVHSLVSLHEKRIVVGSLRFKSPAYTHCRAKHLNSSVGTRIRYKTLTSKCCKVQNSVLLLLSQSNKKDNCQGTKRRRQLDQMIEVHLFRMYRRLPPAMRNITKSQQTAITRIRCLQFYYYDDMDLASMRPQQGT